MSMIAPVKGPRSPQWCSAQVADDHHDDTSARMARAVPTELVLDGHASFMNMRWTSSNG